MNPHNSAVEQEEIAAKIATSLDGTHSWASRRDIILAALRKPTTSQDHQAATSQRLVEALTKEQDEARVERAVFNSLQGLWDLLPYIENQYAERLAYHLRCEIYNLRATAEERAKELSVAKSVAETNAANWLKACDDIAEITKERDGFIREREQLSDCLAMAVGERDEARAAFSRVGCITAKQLADNYLHLLHEQNQKDLPYGFDSWEALLKHIQSVLSENQSLRKSCEDLKAHLAAANKGAQTNAKINASMVAQLHDLKAANAVLEREAKEAHERVAIAMDNKLASELEHNRTVDALHEKLSALECDKVRLDWLESQTVSWGRLVGIPESMPEHTHALSIGLARKKTTASNLRAAIDSASTTQTV